MFTTKLGQLRLRTVLYLLGCLPLHKAGIRAAKGAVEGGGTRQVGELMYPCYKCSRIDELPSFDHVTAYVLQWL